MSKMRTKRITKQPNPPHPPAAKKSVDGRHYALLAVLTLICLVPFSGKPFHVDDPLFVWTAQHIVHHPFDPYGFSVVWYTTSEAASEVIKNPPLASYYIAGVGTIASWSERVLHVAFLLPALVVVLGTYYLAGRFTQNRMLAAIGTLLTPGFLVSSTNVMCDTMMLAAWILAMILWLEGLDRMSPLLMTGSALLISICVCTKYFGIALIPLLVVYSVARKQPIRSWAFYLLIPLALLGAYQYWTHALYGKGLLADAAAYALNQDTHPGGSAFAKTIVGLGFVGGCALTGLTCIPLLWSRRQILLGVAIAGFVGLACANDWISLDFKGEHRNWVCVELAFFVSGGLLILALSIADWWKQKGNPEALLLVLWVGGTFIFAAFVNWTINARSVLPLIPAVGILLARRVDSMPAPSRWRGMWKLAVPLAVAGIVSLWVTLADFQLATSARLAARYFQETMGSVVARVSFQGHLGFQYYMQNSGFQPFDSDTYDYESGNILILPENNDNVAGIAPNLIASSHTRQFALKAGAATLEPAMGAGFYCDCWGPLPYAFGPVPSELYAVVQTIDRQRRD